jgi:hypothetical protein
MPTYSLLVTTPLLDGTQAPEPPLPFDAADDAGAVHVGEAEAERRMGAGAAAWPRRRSLQGELPTCRPR